ncbi:hypothetical protein A5730_14650 [Mycobacterium sp. ACS4054]|nr:hypothetical protein A5730_14650 [Mycobacterium sp. ACS4054]
MPQLQPSDQAGLNHRPIFDPKATNKELTDRAAALGWNKIPVPDGLKEFGLDWDAGKRTTLAEWQFSNYPFLWNNVIRTQGVYVSGIHLAGMAGVEALIVVTKCGLFPASNSTLYYEQGRAQLEAAMTFKSFTVPIRFVGLSIQNGVSELEAMWNLYANPRYDRVPASRELRTFDVAWRGRPAKHGNYAASLSLK